MIVRVVSEHPDQKDKREKIQQAPDHVSADKICRSIRGIDGMTRYQLQRDRKATYQDSFGWTHTITIENNPPKGERK